MLGVSELESEVRYPVRCPKIEATPVERDDLIPKPELEHSEEIVEVP